MALNTTTFQAYGLVVTAEEDGGVADTFKSGTQHHVVTGGQLRGHDLAAGPYGDNTKKLKITAGADTVYLPFWNDQVSSVALPRAGASVFVTDNMSGCCFYIGQKTDGALVAFHANSTKKSSQSDMQGKAANYQHADAVKHLDTLVRGAKAEANVASILAGCSKGEYNQGAARAAGTGAFLGGTTIAGFRTGTKWSFWFQTWGSINGGAVSMIECKEFWKE